MDVDLDYPLDPLDNCFYDQNIPYYNSSSFKRDLFYRLHKIIIMLSTIPEEKIYKKENNNINNRRYHDNIQREYINYRKASEKLSDKNIEENIEYLIPFEKGKSFYLSSIGELDILLNKGDLIEHIEVKSNNSDRLIEKAMVQLSTLFIADYIIYSNSKFSKSDKFKKQDVLEVLINNFYLEDFLKDNTYLIVYPLKLDKDKYEFSEAYINNNYLKNLAEFFSNSLKGAYYWGLYIK